MLRGKPVPTAPGTAEAVADSAERLFRRLKALNAEIKDVQKKIKQIVDRIGTMEGGRAVDILRSVPGGCEFHMSTFVLFVFDSQCAVPSRGKGAGRQRMAVVRGGVPQIHQVGPVRSNRPDFCSTRNDRTACPVRIRQRMPLRFMRWTTSTTFAASTTPDPMPMACPRGRRSASGAGSCGRRPIPGRAPCPRFACAPCREDAGSPARPGPPRRGRRAALGARAGPTLRRLEQGEITAVEAIDALLSEDCALRETRRIDIALRTAKLLPVKTVESFDFAFQPSLDRERIAALAQLDFIRRRETVHFLGPPGTGKSHLATALGVAAVKAGKSVYKTTLAELTDTLAKAERQGQLAEKIRFFARAALLVVDEIGYLPISQGGASLFFQIANARYEKGAIIPASNRSFAEWGDIFGDPSSRRPSSTGSSTTPSSSESKAQATDPENTPTSFPNTSEQMRPSRRRPRRKNEADPKRIPEPTTEPARRQNTEKWGILLRH